MSIPVFIAIEGGGWLSSPLPSLLGVLVVLAAAAVAGGHRGGHPGRQGFWGSLSFAALEAGGAELGVVVIGLAGVVVIVARRWGSPSSVLAREYDQPLNHHLALRLRQIDKDQGSSC